MFLRSIPLAFAHCQFENPLPAFYFRMKNTPETKNQRLKDGRRAMFIISNFLRFADVKLMDANLAYLAAKRNFSSTCSTELMLSFSKPINNQKYFACFVLTRVSMNQRKY